MQWTYQGVTFHPPDVSVSPQVPIPSIASVNNTI